jgi:hypothetical protein
MTKTKPSDWAATRPARLRRMARRCRAWAIDAEERGTPRLQAMAAAKRRTAQQLEREADRLEEARK